MLSKQRNLYELPTYISGFLFYFYMFVFFFCKNVVSVRFEALIKLLKIQVV
jgi:hypothetical protein